jgi:hypothetical protein
MSYGHNKHQGTPLTAYRPWVDPIPRPQSKRLIITVATGNAQKILAHTAGPMKRYASKCGADFIALTTSTQAWPLAEKFRISHYAKYYERVLFLDADVFIKSSATDIFNEVPPGRIALHDDTPGLLSSAHGLDWIRTELEIVCGSQRWPIPMVAYCLNSGVVLFDGVDADLWSPPVHPFPTFHCAEQDIVQFRATATDRLFLLHEKWNWQWWANTEFAGIEYASFVHLAGMSQAYPNMQIPMLRALALTP